ncbi:MAG: hypothetical protein KDB27_03785, partial [Planctomycetales bacterium]|nr:hypothetical protein [Planctomycetales bacterium]
ARLLDFGIAQLAHTESEFGERFGTPVYSSPEQLAGAVTDERTDIYSFGAVACEILSERFGNGGKDWKQNLAEVGIDADLSATVGLCLQRDPQQRYQDIESVANDLRAYLDYRVVSARRASVGHSIRLWWHRAPWQLAAALAIVVLPCIAAGVVWWFQTRPTKNLPTVSSSESLRLSSLDYNSSLYRLHKHAFADQSATNQALMDESVYPKDLRDFAWGFLYHSSLGPRYSHTTLLKPTSVAVHPTQLLAYFGFENGSIACVDLARRVIRWRYATGDNSVVQCMTVDEKELVAATESGNVHCFDAIRCARAWPNGRSDYGKAVFIGSLKNREHVIVNDEGAVFVVVKGETIRRYTIKRFGRHFAIHPEKLLLGCSTKGHVHVLNLGTGEIRTVPSGERETFGMEWTANGDLLRACNGPFIERLDGATLQLAGRIACQQPVAQVKVRAGQVFGLNHRAAQIIAAGDPSASTILKLRPTSYFDRALCPRGVFLATADEYTSTMTIQAMCNHAPEYQRKVGAQLLSLVVNSDRKLAVGIGGPGIVNFINLESGKIELERFFGSQVNNIAVNRSGSHLVVATDEEIGLFQIDNNFPVRSIEPPGRIRAVACSGDRFILSTKRGNLFTLDPTQPILKPVVSVPGSQVNGIACLGTAYAVSSLRPPTVTLCNATNQEIKAVAIPKPAMHGSICFDPRGDHVYLGGQQGTVMCVNTKLSKIEFALKLVGIGISRVAISPNGRSLAVGDAAGAIHILDPSTGAVRLKYAAHDSQIVGLDFSTDGMTLYSGARDGYLRTWQASFPKAVQFEAPSL